MKLIPAIDLMNGKCVRLFKGDFNKRKDFSREPYEQAKYWEK
jgi:phosphoribosylformimino-5-aminoimidazole carboxamide ribotide isomerase